MVYSRPNYTTTEDGELYYASLQEKKKDMGRTP